MQERGGPVLKDVYMYIIFPNEKSEARISVRAFSSIRYWQVN